MRLVEIDTVWLVVRTLHGLFIPAIGSCQYLDVLRRDDKPKIAVYDNSEERSSRAYPW